MTDVSINSHSGDDLSQPHSWWLISLLSAGFGLVAWDRFLLLPMFPVVMRAMGLTYVDLGRVAGALAVSWGLSAFFAGRLSDRLGRRAILVTTLCVFGVCAGLTGLAAGVASLIAIRMFLGAWEGAFFSSSIAAAHEAAPRGREGLALGLQQMSAPLLGLAIAPILVTVAIRWISWRWIFLGVSGPALITAWLLFRALPAAAPGGRARLEPARLKDVLAHRNVPLAAIAMLGWLNALVLMSAFMPNYLIDHLGLGVRQMGFVMTANGVGAVLGLIVIPALSDRVGRKPVMLGCALGGAFFLLCLSHTSAVPSFLFGWLLGASFFLYALLGMTAGPLAVEAVPPHMRATASGFVAATGEVIGGGFAPMLAGVVTHLFGIVQIFNLALVGVALGFLACALLRETAPGPLARIARRKGLDEMVADAGE